MFGMGTGGSLRLLSPETKQGLDPFAAAFLLPVGSAFDLPPDCLRPVRRSFRFPGRARFGSRNRPDALASPSTLKTAQVGTSPPRLTLTLPVRPFETSSAFPALHNFPGSQIKPSTD